MTLNPIDLGDIAATSAALFTLGALIVAIVAAVIASRAKSEASRSADAAEDSASSSRRSADAAEGQTRLAQEQDTRYEPVWELSKAPGGSLGVLKRAVVNRTGENAYQVQVSGTGVTPVGPSEVLDGDALVFAYRSLPAPHERHKPSEVIVRWRRPGYRGSAEQEWRGDLSSL